MKRNSTLSLLFIFFLSSFQCLVAQNIGINTDGSVAETGVMLDVKTPTPKATTSVVATFFQLKSSDADADALKLRFGFKTDATQTNRYGFIDFPDFASGTPTYLNLSLQPSGGNVGIGTTAPFGKLTIVQSTNGYANGVLIYGDAVAGQYLALAVPAAAQALIQSGNTANWQALLLNPNGGNVGVGTTGPVTKFSNTTTNTLDLGGIGVSSTNGLAWLTNTNGYVATFVNTDATAAGRGGILIKTEATDAASYPFQVNVGASNVLTVEGTGLVGIATTNPLAPLHIYSLAGSDTWTTYGASSAVNTDGLNIGYGGATWAGGGQSFLNAHSSVAANGKFRFMINWSDKMIILNDGNVGIGTTTPGNKLTVSTAGVADDVLPALGANGGKFALLNAGYGLLGGVLSSGNSFLQVQRVDATATAYNLLLQPNGGNVGIGTTSPGVKLDMISNDNTDAGGALRIYAQNLTQNATYSFGGVTSSYWYRIVSGTNQHISLMPAGTGNVGIGTTSPGAKLEVAGQVKITGGTPGLGKVLTSDAAGLATWANPLAGTSVLLYNNETSVSGFTYANTTAFTYNVVGTFSQVKVEADIENDCSGGATIGLQGWNYSIVYNGVTKRTAQLWCQDTNVNLGADQNNDWLSGHVSYMGAVANGQTVKIDVINSGTAGTWYVRNFRVYGIY